MLNKLAEIVSGVLYGVDSVYEAVNETSPEKKAVMPFLEDNVKSIAFKLTNKIIIARVYDEEVSSILATTKFYNFITDQHIIVTKFNSNSVESGLDVMKVYSSIIKEVLLIYGFKNGDRIREMSLNMALLFMVKNHDSKTIDTVFNNVDELKKAVEVDPNFIDTLKNIDYNEMINHVQVENLLSL